ncbi:hypothetical protein BDZ89DRAFT_1072038 [Hymenopellis radicata]|nr:hypothetical protein BDZ89DRAFT_1072038 [Hymenopellis radicata]
MDRYHRFSGFHKCVDLFPSPKLPDMSVIDAKLSADVLAPYWHPRALDTAVKLSLNLAALDTARKLSPDVASTCQ